MSAAAMPFPSIITQKAGRSASGAATAPLRRRAADRLRVREVRESPRWPCHPLAHGLQAVDLTVGPCAGRVTSDTPREAVAHPASTVRQRRQWCRGRGGSVSRRVESAVGLANAHIARPRPHMCTSRRPPAVCYWSSRAHARITCTCDHIFINSQGVSFSGKQRCLEAWRDRTTSRSTGSGTPDVVAITEVDAKPPDGRLG